MAFEGVPHRFVDLSALAISNFDYDHANHRDDFLSVARIMRDSRSIFFCSPVYWYAMSAQMKTFFDRLSDLITIEKKLGRSLKGKICHVIVSGTDPELPDCFLDPIRRTCAYFGMSYGEVLYFYAGDDNKFAEGNSARIDTFRAAVWPGL